jgi:hypothetical protein
LTGFFVLLHNMGGGSKKKFIDKKRSTTYTIAYGGLVAGSTNPAEEAGLAVIDNGDNPELDHMLSLLDCDRWYESRVLGDGGDASEACPVPHLQAVTGSECWRCSAKPCRKLGELVQVKTLRLRSNRSLCGSWKVKAKAVI